MAKLHTQSLEPSGTSSTTSPWICALYNIIFGQNAAAELARYRE